MNAAVSSPARIPLECREVTKAPFTGVSVEEGLVQVMDEEKRQLLSMSKFGNSDMF